MRTLTRIDLDNATCQNPDCGHHGEHGEGLHLHPACHPGGGLSMHYGNGVLTMSCHLCNTPVAQIEVAYGQVH